MPNKFLTVTSVNRCGIGIRTILVRLAPIGRRWLDGLLILIVAVVALFGGMRLGLTPRDPAGGVGVVFAPWVSESSAIQRATEAGARIVRRGGLPFIVVVVPDTPDYMTRIAEQALFVVDPRALEACLRLVGGGLKS
jgi:hypothetical protein